MDVYLRPTKGGVTGPAKRSHITVEAGAGGWAEVVVVVVAAKGPVRVMDDVS